MCPNAFYKNKNDYRAKLYCSVNGKPCVHSTLCLRQGRYIESSGMENCSIMLSNIKKDIPNGSSYVRFEKKGFLYIEHGDIVIKVKNTIDTKQDYVYVKKINGEYVISEKPFTEEKEKKTTRTYTKKKKQ